MFTGKNILIYFLLFLLVLLFARLNYWRHEFDICISAPDKYLENTLHKKYGKYDGVITGFVKFYDIQNQPKKMRQYYTIIPYSKNSFHLIEEVKIFPLPLEVLSERLLYIVKDESGVLELKDNTGNRFIIDLSTNNVKLHDVTGDISTLITNNEDYSEFIRNWLLQYLF